MGFALGPIFVGDVRCPSCKKLMIAVNMRRFCPLAHAMASRETEWKPVGIPPDQRTDVLAKLASGGYISQRNYKFAMEQIHGRENPAVKALPGEAVEPPTNFKLFADSDEGSDIKSMLGHVQRLFQPKKKQVEAKEEPKREALEDKGGDDQ